MYRGTFSGLEPLTIDKPLTQEEVRRNPIFYELELHPEQGDENLIIDLIYDNLAPIRLQDLYPGNRYPAGDPVLAGLVRHPAVPGDAGHRRPQSLPACAGDPHGTDHDRRFGSGHRWAGSGTSARRMAGTRARSSRSRSRGMPMPGNEQWDHDPVEEAGEIPEVRPSRGGIHDPADPRQRLDRSG